MRQVFRRDLLHTSPFTKARFDIACVAGLHPVHAPERNGIEVQSPGDVIHLRLEPEERPRRPVAAEGARYPNDLALGSGQGCVTYQESKTVRDAIQKVVEACRRACVIAGLHCSFPELALEWREAGVQMLTTAEDVVLLKMAADAVVHQVTDHGGR